MFHTFTFRKLSTKGGKNTHTIGPKFVIVFSILTTKWKFGYLFIFKIIYETFER